MPASVATFFMFDGKAEAAISLYIEAFRYVSVVLLEKYSAGEEGIEGSVKRGEIMVAGHSIMCIDSPIKHDFDFTPSVSLFVNCEDEDELMCAFTKLEEGGKVLMPLDHYGFSQKFAWLNDRFGVSWQLNLN